MTKAREINRLLKAISNRSGKSDNGNLFFTAEVKKVDAETCDVEVGEFTLTGVHLAAVSDENENNLIIKPKVGSVVLVCDKTGGDLTWLNVVAFSQIASVTMKVDEIVINKGDNGGFCITPELKTQLDKMTARIDGIMDALKNAAVAPQDGGATFKLNIGLHLATLVNKEDFSNIENEKIKH